MERNKVSIIIPIYNVAEYLNECLSSVIHQTYNNLEIILINDGSIDKSPLLCENWAKKDNRIKVIHKENGGLSSARNAGLDIATGKYVYFLDSDDYIELDLIEHLVYHMDQGYDMVTFSFDKVFETGERERIEPSILGEINIQNEAERKLFICTKFLLRQIRWEAWNRIYLRNKIEEYGLRFADNNKIFAEDLYFSLCYLAHTNSILSIPNVLYHYRIRENSIMGKDLEKLNLGRMNELAKEVQEFFFKFPDCNLLVQDFPIIHFLIINVVFDRIINKVYGKWRNVRGHLIDDIGDFRFFVQQVKQLKKYEVHLEQLLYGICEKKYIKEKISILNYIVDGNYLKFWFRNRFISKKEKKELDLEYKKFVKEANGKRRIFLIGTECLGNIGDHQIAESILEFTNSIENNCIIKEISNVEYKTHKIYLQKYIRPTDLILLTGGGNFGDQYIAAQRLREDVVKTWKQNRKIIFPQTVYFTNTKKGKDCIEHAKEVFNEKNNILLFVRDKTSYEFAKKEFSCDCELVPDIVFFSNKTVFKERQHKILMCFRNDVEKKLDGQMILQLEKFLKHKDCTILKTDLQLGYNIEKTRREKELTYFFEQWKTSKLVMTDRLHGMIFAAITGTPCVAFGNYNHKVKEAYDWISYLPYIQFADSMDDAIKWIAQLYELDNCEYDNKKLQRYFDIIREAVENEI